MDLIARRFRGVLIALVVLGLSASAVFAGHVVLQGPATVPTASEQGDQDEQADENETEAPEAPEAAETDEADSQDAPETDEADGQDAPETNVGGGTADNHGALVSAAAQMTTPPLFKNHGAFVSCVAHMKSLPEGVTDQAVFLAALTPTACDAAAATRSAEKAAAKAAAKAERQQGKAAKHGKGHKQS